MERIQLVVMQILYLYKYHMTYPYLVAWFLKVIDVNIPVVLQMEEVVFVFLVKKDMKHTLFFFFLSLSLSLAFVTT